MASLWDRGARWQEAGRTVGAIFDSTYALEPDPIPGAVLVFSHIPDSLEPDIAPGGTGPYLLRHGIATGVRMRYGRGDIVVIDSTTTVPAVAAAVVCLDVRGEVVVRVACRR